MTKQTGWLGVVAAWVIFCGATAHGQSDRKAVSPEKLVADALAGFNQGRIEPHVDAMDPQALAQFRRAITGLFAAAEKDGKADQLLGLFPGVKEPGDLKKLDDRALFAAYLRGMTSRLDQETKEMVAKTKIEVLGHTGEGKDIAHVVYRAKIGGDDAGFERMYVASVRKQPAGWGMLLGSEVEGMLGMLKERMEGNLELPDMKGAKVMPVGEVAEGSDRVHVVYRATFPIGKSSITKLAVATVAKSEPEWALLRSGKPADMMKLLRQKAGLD
jgi:hypothetical protein